MIRPEDFHAVGDGRADDTRAVQAALTRAGVGGLVRMERRYRTAATLRLPSGLTLDGTGGVVLAHGADMPALASDAWASPGAPLVGRTRIIGLRVEASGAGAGQDGLVLHDFWSLVEGCEIVGPGGRGVVLTATDRAGTPVGSTLVENRVRGTIVRDARGTAFFLGEPANGKLTDGELSGCIASLADGVTAPAVTVGHAAGWTLRDIHTYGGRPQAAVEIRQGYFTRVGGLYVESFGAVGLALDAVQTTVAVSDTQIAVERSPEGGAFLAVSAHADYPAPVVQLSGVTCLAFGPGGEAVALRNRDGRVRVVGSPVLAMAAGSPAIGRGDASEPGFGTQALRWMGRGAQEFSLLTLGPETATDQDGAVSVRIVGRAPDGALVTSFSGTLSWWRRAGGGLVADLVPAAAAVGFQMPPAVSPARQGDAIALVLRFAPLSSGPGLVAVG